ncbi:MAG: hypothetical protein AAF649_04115 [Verrucomicrobiota bacterium]
MPNTLNVLTKSNILVEFFTHFTEEYYKYDFNSYFSFEEFTSALESREKTNALVDAASLVDVPPKNFEEFVERMRNNKVYLGILAAPIHENLVSSLCRKYPAISAFEKPIKKPELLHWLRTQEVRKTLRVPSNITLENIDFKTTMNELEKNYGVSDYFVLSATGETLESSSAKSKMLQEATIYSSQICNKISESTGFGNLYEMRADSPSSSISFFSANTKDSFKTYGIMCDQSYSMDDIINRVRLEASNE